MNLLIILRIIVLVTNGVYCFAPRSDFGATSSSLTKTLLFPAQQQAAQKNDISIYDPGVDKPKSAAPQVAFPQMAFNPSPPSALNRMSGDNEYDNVDAQNSVEDTLGDGNRFYINQLLGSLRDEIHTDEEFARKSAMLLKLLEESMNSLPIVYVEDDIDEIDDFSPDKRSGRYYRRYPWKRQNTRSRTRYESESRYLCIPSREDVFKLLVGLHEHRNGNHLKTVQFCNRKRPAKKIFTNIRFLG